MFAKCIHRNQIPGVPNCNEGRNIVDFIKRVRDLRLFDLMADRNAVPVMRPLVIEARLHLNAQQTSSMLHEKMVRMAVAVRLGDADSLPCSAIHEGQFGELAHTLGIGAALRGAGSYKFQVGTPWE